MSMNMKNADSGIDIASPLSRTFFLFFFFLPVLRKLHVFDCVRSFLLNGNSMEFIRNKVQSEKHRS